MSKVSIVYWSGTGNTQKMAEAVAEGVKEAGAEADLKFVSAATVDELAGICPWLPFHGSRGTGRC